jgi:hypothetical protein
MARPFAKGLSQAEIHYEFVNAHGMNSMTFQGGGHWC